LQPAKPPEQKPAVIHGGLFVFITSSVSKQPAGQQKTGSAGTRLAEPAKQHDTGLLRQVD